MKKTIFALILTIIGISVFSQDEPSYYYCYRLTSADWNRSTQTWDFNNPKPSTLTLKFYRNIITINDEAQSRYETFTDGVDKKTSTYEAKEWNAFDEKNRKVEVKIIRYFERNELVFMVVYDTYLLAYSINKSGLSPL